MRNAAPSPECGRGAGGASPFALPLITRTRPDGPISRKLRGPLPGSERGASRRGAARSPSILGSSLSPGRPRLTQRPATSTTTKLASGTPTCKPSAAACSASISAAAPACIGRRVRSRWAGWSGRSRSGSAGPSCAFRVPAGGGPSALPAEDDVAVSRPAIRVAFEVTEGTGRPVFWGMNRLLALVGGAASCKVRLATPAYSASTAAWCGGRLGFGRSIC